MPFRKKLIIFLGVILITAVTLANFLKQHYALPILMYHSVTKSATPKDMLSISVKTFDRQMAFLKRHHYNVMPLEAIVNLIRDKKKIPAKTIAITFDDGNKDNFTNALPILKKYNLPATIFIIVNEVGRPQGDKLNWDEIKIMQASGIINFGSHTLDHAVLTKLTNMEDLHRQIFDSKRILEERLSQKINLFSYPEGFYNANIRQTVADAGYSGAVSTKRGGRFGGYDLFALKRLRISEKAANMFVFAVETSGYYTFLKEYKMHKAKDGKK